MTNELLDGGSDLSDLSDSESDEVPLSPGIASTPRTTPTPVKKEGKPIKESPRSPLATELHERRGRKQDKVIVRSEKEPASYDIGSKSKSKQGIREKKSGKKDHQNGSDDGASTSTSKDKAKEFSKQDLPTKLVQEGSSIVKPVEKKASMKGWAYVPFTDEKKNEETAVDTAVETKRTRRTTLQYNASSSKPARTASSSELPTAEKGRETGSPLTTTSNVGTSETRPRINIKLHLTSKKKEQASMDDVDDAGKGDNKEEDFKPLTMSPMDEDDDEDENVVPSLKRKRAKGQLKVEEEDDGDLEKEVKLEKVKSEARKSEQPNKQKRQKTREERRASKVIRNDETFAASDGSDDYNQGKDSEDEAMSEYSDDEALRNRNSKATPIVKEATTSIPRLKRRSEGLVGNESKTAPRNSTGSNPIKKPNTVAGLISAYAKPPSTLLAQTSVKPIPAKSAIRKVPSLNLFDNLMGFGSSTKEGTPGKSPAVRPRPSGSNTPQGTSPMVRPPGSIKREDEKSTSGTSTPTRMQSTLSKSSPLASNGKSKPGANGEHVTAAEMAIRRKQELYFNANPTGLFDLLEGAEIMLEFQSEVRQLLPDDPLLSKYQLYKPSRTEGLSKLIDRIKDSNRGQSQKEIETQTQIHTPSEIPLQAPPLQTNEKVT